MIEMARRAMAAVAVAALVAGCSGGGGADPGPTPSDGDPSPSAGATDDGSEVVATGPVEHWITVQDGQLVDRRTGEVFVPRGVNLLRKEYGNGDKLFSPYRPVWVGDQLDAIAELGFNAIRVFTDMCMSCTATSAGLREAFLDGLADLVTQAADRGLVLLLTSNDVPDPGYAERLPCCEPFGGYRNSQYLSEEGHDIAVEYFTDVIAGLQERGAPLEAVLAWQLANEQFFLRSVPPISLTEGEVTTADGLTWDLADDDAVRAMLESNLLAYLDRVGTAIRSLDPHGLVTMGFFAPEDPDAGRDAGDDRWVLTERVLHESTLDLVDLHSYPGLGAVWESQVTAFGLDAAVTMPVVLGEFGAFTVAYDSPAAGAAEMARWQAASCAYGFAGWLVWLWGIDVDDEVWPAEADDAAIGRALSPLVRPDPCDVGEYANPNLAFGRPVTASAEEAGEGGAYRASSAVDGSAGTWWSASEGPPQWIEVDLGEPVTVARVRILIGSVSPSGPQTHRVSVRRGAGAALESFGSVTADAAHGDWLEVAPEVPFDGVTAVRVETVAMDGWVILHEVEVLGP